MGRSGAGKRQLPNAATASSSRQARQKKLSWLSIFGIIEIQEQVWRLKRRGPLLRPFCQRHHLDPGGCSRRVRRAMVDFGAEESFAAAAARLQEHHGVRVSAWRVREQTYRHAKTMAALEPAQRPPSDVLVTQIDGSMIPVLDRPANGPEDKRRARKVVWRETRACLARDQNSATPLYGATLGSVEVAGALWGQVAQSAGLTEKTFVHAIADGAPWIFPQAQTQFGEKLTCLVDFYHVSEYVAAAAPPGQKAKAWLRRQQDHLLANRAGQVLRNLAPRREPATALERPVAEAYRYIDQRREHLDYAGARERKLPIGSGEIESAHRHLIQPRLKIPGAWKETHAQQMLSLRTARANGLWEKSWGFQLN